MPLKPKWTVDSPEVIERCTNPAPDYSSLNCPHCGSPEVFKDEKNPRNTDKWFWVIRAFRVDDQSECRGCGKWFGLND